MGLANNFANSIAEDGQREGERTSLQPHHGAVETDGGCAPQGTSAIRRSLQAGAQGGQCHGYVGQYRGSETLRRLRESAHQAV